MVVFSFPFLKSLIYSLILHVLINLTRCLSTLVVFSSIYIFLFFFILFIIYCCCSCSVVSHVRIFATPWSTLYQASLSFTISQSLLKFMSTESVMPSNHLIFCHPLLLLPSNFPSIRVFHSESALRIRWSTYWSFSYNISPSNEYSELISFRIGWFDLFAVQGTLKSLLEHHSLKASIVY